MKSKSRGHSGTFYDLNPSGSAYQCTQWDTNKAFFPYAGDSIDIQAGTCASAGFPNRVGVSEKLRHYDITTVRTNWTA
eukprot:CAMPEP_0114558150 /NCGR_PEP_ID=MMETSP0114-20121206/10218_1 /TAXON_ID=31324 /ORGANISM="Goniomonas sp, Strain m" /LENGTH=77 /DNA_ID=CAMNT_0001743501 /DNA_START=44 /DNA_END=277 /DNA_ORIENTATION=+